MDNIIAKMKTSFNQTEDEQLIEMVKMHQYLYDLQHPLHNDQLGRENAWQEISQILERPVENCKRRWKNIKDAHRRRTKIGKIGSAASKSPLVKLLSFLDNVKARQRKTLHSTKTNVSQNFKTDIDIQRHPCTTIKAEENNYDTDESMDQNLNNNNDIITDSDTTLDFPDPLSTIQNQQRICEYENDDKKTIVKGSDLNLDENMLSVIQKELKILKGKVERQEDSVDLFFRSLSMSVKNLRPDLISEAKIKMLQLVIDLENQNNYQL